MGCAQKRHGGLNSQDLGGSAGGPKVDTGLEVSSAEIGGAKPLSSFVGRLRSDPRFRLVSEAAACPRADVCVRFRLCPRAATMGRSPEALRRKFGVDMPAAQRAFARLVNGRACPLLVATVRSESAPAASNTDCIVAPTTATTCNAAVVEEEAWRVFSKQADAALRRALESVPSCDCGQ
jgi:hypothetical protein